MYPILLKFGFIQIYSYGLMVALAFGFAPFCFLNRRAPWRWRRIFSGICLAGCSWEAS